MDNENRTLKWKALDEYLNKNYVNEIKRCNTIGLKPKHGIKRDPLPSLNRSMVGPDLSDLIINQDETFQEMLFRLIDSKGLKDSIVYTKASVDKRLFSKIRSDKDYHPSKNTVILLCLALELQLDTALDLLKKSGYTLSNSRKEDIIVKYFIENNDFNILKVNEALYDYDLPLLVK